jgi:hypothetical protein
MKQFSDYSISTFMGNLQECPARKTVSDLGAVAVQRECENRGTFLVTGDGFPVAYVPNSARLDGEWAYYSDTVARHYGLRYFA